MMIFDLKRKGITLLALIALISFSCMSDFEVVQSSNTDYSNIDEVQMDIGFLDVTYIGDPNRTEVNVEILLQSTKRGIYQIVTEERDGVLIITLERNGTSTSGSHQGMVNILGPRDMEFSLIGSSGTTAVSDVNADNFNIMMSSGNLAVGRVESESISLELTSGRIEGESLIGSADINISSGNLIVDEMEGDITFEGTSGDVELIRVEGRVDATLSSGNINLVDVDELGSVEVSSGRIEGVNVGLGPETTLTSTSGNITINTFSNLDDYNFDMRTSSGRVEVGDRTSEGQLVIDNGSDFTVVGRCGSGNIKIDN